MLTWRYHLLSLVAVFLALGLGLLGGISLSDNGALESGQSNLVEDIERDVEALQQENDDLQKERGASLRFQDDAFPFIVSGRLQGKKIALVTSGSTADDLRRDITSAIHAAGGQVVTTTILSSRFDRAAAAAKLKNDFKNESPWNTVDEASVINPLASELAKEICKPSGARVLGSLRGTGVDSVAGSYESPVDAVVFVNRADDEQAPGFAELEKQLLLAMKETGITVIGGEPADSPRSDVPLFISVDVSSIDNLETRIGQVSLVFALSGEKGAFGVKPTADMLIPILRQPKTQAGQTQTVPQTSTAQAGG
jgi:hypothetical protein